MHPSSFYFFFHFKLDSYQKQKDFSTFSVIVQIQIILNIKFVLIHHLLQQFSSLHMSKWRLLFNVQNFPVCFPVCWVKDSELCFRLFSSSLGYLLSYCIFLKVMFLLFKINIFSLLWYFGKSSKP